MLISNLNFNIKLGLKIRLHKIRNSWILTRNVKESPHQHHHYCYSLIYEFDSVCMIKLILSTSSYQVNEVCIVKR